MHFTVCDFALDIVQNAVEAGAPTVELTVKERTGRSLNIEVRDDGPGMDQDTLKKACDPFYTKPGKHDRRTVGLGLPFLKQAAEQSEGSFEVRSVPGSGTKVCFSFDLSHIDTPPLGDVAAMVLSACMFEGNYELRVLREKNGKSYSFSRSEFKEQIGDWFEASIVLLARTYLQGLEEDLTT